MATPTLDYPAPPLRSRGLTVPLILAAVLGAAALAAVLFVTGALHAATNVTSVVKPNVVSSRESSSSLNASAIYTSAATGAVDVTARGVSSSQGGPGSQASATGSGSVIDAAVPAPVA